MKATDMAMITQRVCRICPLNRSCKRFGNPKILGLCQEIAIWCLFAAAIAIEVKVVLL